MVGMSYRVLERQWRKLRTVVNWRSLALFRGRSGHWAMVEYCHLEIYANVSDSPIFQDKP